MGNPFLLDKDLIPFNDKMNLKMKKKRIPEGLRLASIEWPKELKEERETKSLRIKTCY